jgi:hypothetical protein
MENNHIWLGILLLTLATKAAGQSFVCEGPGGTTQYNFNTATMTVVTNSNGTKQRKGFNFKSDEEKIAVINYPEIAQQLPDFPSTTEINLKTGTKRTYSTTEFKRETNCSPLDY